MTGGAGLGQSDRVDNAKHIAEAYFETRNYERAREVLRGVLAEHPNDPAALADYARAEYLLDNYPGAASSRLRRTSRRTAGRDGHAHLCAIPRWPGSAV